MVSFFFVFLQIEKVKNKNKKGDMKKQGLLFVLLALTACASAQNTFSKDYGIVGEGEDKVYIANNIRDYYVDVEDFFDTTYLLAFDLITGKKDTLMSFETASYTGMGFYRLFVLRIQNSSFFRDGRTCGELAVFHRRLQ